MAEYLFHLKIGLNISKSTLDSGVPIKKIGQINVNHEGKFLLSQIKHCLPFKNCLNKISSFKKLFHFTNLFSIMSTALKMKDNINPSAIGISNALAQLESKVTTSVTDAETSG